MNYVTDHTLVVRPSDFFQLLYPELYRYVARATGAGYSDVEDIVSETLLHAWRDRDRFRGDASLVTWALSIARNRVREWRRKAALQQRSEDVLKAITRMDSESVPEHLLQDLEARRMVRETLEAMPAPQSQVLIERYFEGKTLKDIAAQSEETEEAVESRLRRARETFRESLQRRHAHEEP
jgi:RNA polymerase sigma-70 factor (ECF subfamily)